MASHAVINGFSKDITLLLKRFVKLNSTNFKCFSNEWKRMNFHYIFFGYSCLSEMLQFLEDAFITLKHVLLNATCTLEQIGALYLMYAMYFKQPTKQYCKFRVTLDEWTKMNKFYNEICGVHAQVSLVFWKLIKADAFRFVEAEYEYGFERFMQKGFSKVELPDAEDKFKQANPMFQSVFNSLRNQKMGLIPALEILEVGYNEMKEHLCQASTTKAISPTSITSGISHGLLKIEKLFKDRFKDDDSDEDLDLTNDEFLNQTPAPTKLELKRKGFRKQSIAQAASTSDGKKKLSNKYRGTVSEDGELIKIKRPPHIKSKSHPFNERQVKTVVKQLHLPFDGESELALPSPSDNLKIKSEKPDQTTVAHLSLPSIFSTTD